MRRNPIRALGYLGFWFGLLILWLILAIAVEPHIDSEFAAVVCGFQGLATVTLVPYVLALRWSRRG